PPKRLQASITSRFKIMGNLNIAEKRLPQDGRIRRVIAGKEIDVRLSSIPTTFGERLVMRILDRSSVLLDLKELGFTDENFAKFEDLIYRPYGIILVTGPTGSGKTTTLYAALSRINTPDKNILTIEDPVEYQIQGIGQMQVNPKIDFTFASGLRSILRQDPDVILVGEIRDLETAEISVQASLTGHLVFSTLHTNDASSAFTRLIDMGVEPFLISSSVLAMIAQRLVRVLCVKCREPYKPVQAELNKLGISRLLPGDTFFRAKGCEECTFTGYSGRAGIYEVLFVDDPIRELVMKNTDANTIKKKAIERGMKTLRDDGAIKARTGMTTIEEVMRVTQDEIIE
ncbi:MAG: Flp pilus assembly complex ATPase component TadA, partial [Deltaproteobacteria bacterium]|nr:Flp pilus assembly complex ATPase component TadA [Deltaproteobacteria bacterium]